MGASLGEGHGHARPPRPRSLDPLGTDRPHGRPGDAPAASDPAGQLVPGGGAGAAHVAGLLGPAVDNPGYHVHAIAKGEVGELSKILEELAELADAEAQGVKVMALVELSDLVGAIEAYLARHHPGITLADLKAMSAVTVRAFTSGRRS